MRPIKNILFAAIILAMIQGITMNLGYGLSWDILGILVSALGRAFKFQIFFSFNDLGSDFQGSGLAIVHGDQILT